MARRAAITASLHAISSFRAAGATCGSAFNGGDAMWLYVCDGFSSVVKCSRCEHRCAAADSGTRDVCDLPGWLTQPAPLIDDTPRTSGSQQLSGNGTVNSFNLSYNEL